MTHDTWHLIFIYMSSFFGFYCIGATFRTRWDIQYLLYAGFIFYIGGFTLSYILACNLSRRGPWIQGVCWNVVSRRPSGSSNIFCLKVKSVLLMHAGSGRPLFMFVRPPPAADLLLVLPSRLWTFDTVHCTAHLEHVESFAHLLLHLQVWSWTEQSNYCDIQIHQVHIFLIF